jgi:hypothetical protein
MDVTSSTGAGFFGALCAEPAGRIRKKQAVNKRRE